MDIKTYYIFTPETTYKELLKEKKDIDKLIHDSKNKPMFMRYFYNEYYNRSITTALKGYTWKKKG